MEQGTRQVSINISRCRRDVKQKLMRSEWIHTKMVTFTWCCWASNDRAWSLTR